MQYRNECDIKCTVRLHTLVTRVYNILTAQGDLIISSRDASKVTRLTFIPIITVKTIKVAFLHTGG